ncbi:MAG: hypothetical protein EOO54_27765 [Haliea sp.]|nr:MAG: hypothetical protein EOO54_27765 [Haliea sp.]
MGGSEALRALFEGVMGMRPGYRPPFPFPGLWLYAGDQAVVHAVNDAALSAGSADLRFGHVAFRSNESACSVIERVRQSRLPFQIAQVPQDNTTQIFVQLPGGLVVELDVPDEAAPANAAAELPSAGA